MTHNFFRCMHQLLSTSQQPFRHHILSPRSLLLAAVTRSKANTPTYSPGGRPCMVPEAFPVVLKQLGGYCQLLVSSTSMKTKVFYSPTKVLYCLTCQALPFTPSQSHLSGAPSVCIDFCHKMSPKPPTVWSLHGTLSSSAQRQAVSPLSCCMYHPFSTCCLQTCTAKVGCAYSVYHQQGPWHAKNRLSTGYSTHLCMCKAPALRPMEW